MRKLLRFHREISQTWNTFFKAIFICGCFILYPIIVFIAVIYFFYGIAIVFGL